MKPLALVTLVTAMTAGENGKQPDRFKLPPKLLSTPLLVQNMLTRDSGAKSLFNTVCLHKLANFTPGAVVKLVPKDLKMSSAGGDGRGAQQGTPEPYSQQAMMERETHSSWMQRTQQLNPLNAQTSQMRWGGGQAIQNQGGQAMPSQGVPAMQGHGYGSEHANKPSGGMGWQGTVSPEPGKIISQPAVAATRMQGSGSSSNPVVAMDLSAGKDTSHKHGSDSSHKHHHHRQQQQNHHQQSGQHHHQQHAHGQSQGDSQQGRSHVAVSNLAGSPRGPPASSSVGQKRPGLGVETPLVAPSLDVSSSKRQKQSLPLSQKSPSLTPPLSLNSNNPVQHVPANNLAIQAQASLAALNAAQPGVPPTHPGQLLSMGSVVSNVQGVSLGGRLSGLNQQGGQLQRPSSRGRLAATAGDAASLKESAAKAESESAALNALQAMVPSLGPYEQVPELKLATPALAFCIGAALRTRETSNVRWALNCLSLWSFHRESSQPGIQSDAARPSEEPMESCKDMFERTPLVLSGLWELVEEAVVSKEPSTSSSSAGDRATQKWWWERSSHGIMSSANAASESERLTWASCASNVLRNVAFAEVHSYASIASTSSAPPLPPPSAPAKGHKRACTSGKGKSHTGRGGASSGSKAAGQPEVAVESVPAPPAGREGGGFVPTQLVHLCIAVRALEASCMEPCTAFLEISTNLLEFLHAASASINLPQLGYTTPLPPTHAANPLVHKRPLAKPVPPPPSSFLAAPAAKKTQGGPGLEPAEANMVDTTTAVPAAQETQGGPSQEPAEVNMVDGTTGGATQKTQGGAGQVQAEVNMVDATTAAPATQKTQGGPGQEPAEVNMVDGTTGGAVHETQGGAGQEPAEANMVDATTAAPATQKTQGGPGQEQGEVNMVDATTGGTTQETQGGPGQEPAEVNMVDATTGGTAEEGGVGLKVTPEPTAHTHSPPEAHTQPTYSPHPQPTAPHSPAEGAEVGPAGGSRAPHPQPPHSPDGVAEVRPAGDPHASHPQPTTPHSPAEGTELRPAGGAHASHPQPPHSPAKCAEVRPAGGAHASAMITSPSAHASPTAGEEEETQTGPAPSGSERQGAVRGDRGQDSQAGEEEETQTGLAPSGSERQEPVRSGGGQNSQAGAGPGSIIDVAQTGKSGLGLAGGPGLGPGGGDLELGPGGSASVRDEQIGGHAQLGTSGGRVHVPQGGPGSEVHAVEGGPGSEVRAAQAESRPEVGSAQAGPGSEVKAVQGGPEVGLAQAGPGSEVKAVQGGPEVGLAQAGPGSEVQAVQGGPEVGLAQAGPGSERDERVRGVEAGEHVAGSSPGIDEQAERASENGPDVQERESCTLENGPDVQERVSCTLENGPDVQERVSCASENGQDVQERVSCEVGGSGGLGNERDTAQAGGGRGRDQQAGGVAEDTPQAGAVAESSQQAGGVAEDTPQAEAVAESSQHAEGVAEDTQQAEAVAESSQEARGVAENTKRAEPEAVVCVQLNGGNHVLLPRALSGHLDDGQKPASTSTSHSPPCLEGKQGGSEQPLGREYPGLTDRRHPGPPSCSKLGSSGEAGNEKAVLPEASARVGLLPLVLEPPSAELAAAGNGLSPSGDKARGGQSGDSSCPPASAPSRAREAETEPNAKADFDAGQNGDPSCPPASAPSQAREGETEPKAKADFDVGHSDPSCPSTLRDGEGMQGGQALSHVNGVGQAGSPLTGQQGGTPAPAEEAVGGGCHGCPPKDDKALDKAPPAKLATNIEASGMDVDVPTPALELAVPHSQPAAPESNLDQGKEEVTQALDGKVDVPDEHGWAEEVAEPPVCPLLEALLHLLAHPDIPLRLKTSAAGVLAGLSRHAGNLPVLVGFWSTPGHVGEPLVLVDHLLGCNYKEAKEAGELGYLDAHAPSYTYPYAKGVEDSAILHLHALKLQVEAVHSAVQVLYTLAVDNSIQGMLLEQPGILRRLVEIARGLRPKSTSKLCGDEHSHGDVLASSKQPMACQVQRLSKRITLDALRTLLKLSKSKRGVVALAAHESNLAIDALTGQTRFPNLMAALLLNISTSQSGDASD
eukprot:gene30311-35301_t